MITVEEASLIIAAHARDFGAETISINHSVGRVLAAPIICDRELPACNRVTMDGIAISYTAFAAGIRSFKILATQPAGAPPVDITNPDECIEIMTGGALPDTTDTVIRYEDMKIENGLATLLIDEIRQAQNIHPRGKDRRQGDVLAPAGCRIDATVVSIAASAGYPTLDVKKLPRVAIISTGDELVDVDQTPTPWQVRRSNTYTLRAQLVAYNIDATIYHWPDAPEVMEQKLLECLQQFDVLLLSGGVSMGKFDYLPSVLEKSGVDMLFHKVRQRPGKPFWFGRKPDGPLVFAFPGNPVSAFMCLNRYFIPWLQKSMNLKTQPPLYAKLGADVTFTPPLQYFMQVSLTPSPDGSIVAHPIQGNGSGDMGNLLETNAFLELPYTRDTFSINEVFRAWPYKNWTD